MLGFILLVNKAIKSAVLKKGIIMGNGSHGYFLKQKKEAEARARERAEKRQNYARLQEESSPEAKSAAALRDRAKAQGFNSSDPAKIQAFLADPAAFKKGNPQHFQSHAPASSSAQNKGPRKNSGMRMGR